jgi:hypothetical protein
MTRPCIIEFSAESSVTFLLRSEVASVSERLRAAASSRRLRFSENAIVMFVMMKNTMKAATTG